MMPRNLLDEVVRRRLWPLLAVAALILLAAPLLFLKSAPEGSPTADTAAPAAPATAKLPARAARLLATSDAGGSRGRATGSARDPFTPPSSQQTGAAPSTTAGTTDTSAKSTSSKSGKTKPVPVVIQNADGSSTKPSSSTTSNDTTNGNDSTSAPSNALTAGSAAVAVRFGKSQDSTLRRAVAPMQAFFIRGKVAAVFVKYSPSLRKAVFAVAPGIHVSGPVTCRVQNGACRYLDIPAGSYVRLTMITAKREVVRRRLDVEHITRRSGSQTTAAAASASDVSVCFLHKLQAMKPGSALVDRDACER